MLQDAEDAILYRRRFVIELLMSAHGSSATHEAVAELALGVVLRAAGVRHLANHLVLRCGE